MATDIVEQRRLGGKVLRLFDFPFSLNDLTALERVGEKVLSIREKNGLTLIVVEPADRNTSKTESAPEMLWSAAGD